MAYSLTAEALTVNQINQLREAWKREHDEVTRYKDFVQKLQRENEDLHLNLKLKSVECQMQTIKCDLSTLCGSNPARPCLLLKEMLASFPTIDGSKWSGCVMVKTGEQWTAFSSACSTEEYIQFRSARFDEALRIRAEEMNNPVSMENLSNLLRNRSALNYIRKGEVTVGDEVSGLQDLELDAETHGRDVNDVIMFRCPNFEDNSRFKVRCVWLISLQDDRPGDLGRSSRARLDPSNEGLKSLVALNEIGEQFLNGAQENWQESLGGDSLLIFCEGLVMNAVVQLFEKQQSRAEMLELRVERQLFAELPGNVKKARKLMDSGEYLAASWMVDKIKDILESELLHKFYDVPSDAGIELNKVRPHIEQDLFFSSTAYHPRSMDGSIGNTSIPILSSNGSFYVLSSNRNVPTIAQGSKQLEGHVNYALYTALSTQAPFVYAYTIDEKHQDNVHSHVIVCIPILSSAVEEQHSLGPTHDASSCVTGCYMLKLSTGMMHHPFNRKRYADEEAAGPPIYWTRTLVKELIHAVRSLNAPILCWLQDTNYQAMNQLNKGVTAETTEEKRAAMHDLAVEMYDMMSSMDPDAASQRSGCRRMAALVNDMLECDWSIICCLPNDHQGTVDLAHTGSSSLLASMKNLAFDSGKTPRDGQSHCGVVSQIGFRSIEQTQLPASLQQQLQSMMETDLYGEMGLSMADAKRDTNTHNISLDPVPGVNTTAVIFYQNVVGSTTSAQQRSTVSDFLFIASGDDSDKLSAWEAVLQSNHHFHLCGMMISNSFGASVPKQKGTGSASYRVAVFAGRLWRPFPLTALHSEANHFAAALFNATQRMQLEVAQATIKHYQHNMMLSSAEELLISETEKELEAMTTLVLDEPSDAGDTTTNEAIVSKITGFHSNFLHLLQNFIHQLWTVYGFAATIANIHVIACDTGADGSERLWLLNPDNRDSKHVVWISLDNAVSERERERSVERTDRRGERGRTRSRSRSPESARRSLPRTSSKRSNEVKFRGRSRYYSHSDLAVDLLQKLKEDVWEVIDLFDGSEDAADVANGNGFAVEVDDIVSQSSGSSEGAAAPKKLKVSLYVEYEKPSSAAAAAVNTRIIQNSCQHFGDWTQVFSKFLSSYVSLLLCGDLARVVGDSNEKKHFKHVVETQLVERGLKSESVRLLDLWSMLHIRRFEEIGCNALTEALYRSSVVQRTNSRSLMHSLLRHYYQLCHEQFITLDPFSSFLVLDVEVDVQHDALKVINVVRDASISVTTQLPARMQQSVLQAVKHALAAASRSSSTSATSHFLPLARLSSVMYNYLEELDDELSYHGGIQRYFKCCQDISTGDCLVRCFHPDSELFLYFTVIPDELLNVFIIVPREDRVLSDSQTNLLLQGLHKLHDPLKTIAASRTWMECLMGIEKLVSQRDLSDFSYRENLTVEITADMKPGQQEPVVAMDRDGSVLHNVLADACRAMELIIGSECLAIGSYAFPVDALVSLDSNDDESKSGDESSSTDDRSRTVELDRCVEITPSNTLATSHFKGIFQTLGPARLRVPGDSSALNAQYAANTLHSRKDASTEDQPFQLHLMQFSHTQWNSYIAKNSVDDAEALQRMLNSQMALNSNVMIVQAFLTARLSSDAGNDGDTESTITTTDTCLASFVIFLSVPGSAPTAPLERTASFGSVQTSKQGSQSPTARSHHAHHHHRHHHHHHGDVAALSNGTTNYLMRLLNVAGSLVVDLYRHHFSLQLQQRRYQVSEGILQHQCQLLKDSQRDVHRRLSFAVSRKHLNQILHDVPEFVDMSPEALGEETSAGSFDSSVLDITVEQAVYTITHYASKFYEEMQSSAALFHKLEEKTDELHVLLELVYRFIDEVRRINARIAGGSGFCSSLSFGDMLSNRGAVATNLESLCKTLDFNMGLLSWCLKEVVDCGLQELLWKELSVLSDPHSEADDASVGYSVGTKATSPLDVAMAHKIKVVWLMDIQLQLLQQKGKSEQVGLTLEDLEHDPEIINLKKLLLAVHTKEAAILKSEELVSSVAGHWVKYTPILLSEYRVDNSLHGIVIAVIQSVHRGSRTDVEEEADSLYSAAVSIAQCVAHRYVKMRYELQLQLPNVSDASVVSLRKPTVVRQFMVNADMQWSAVSALMSNAQTRQLVDSFTSLQSASSWNRLGMEYLKLIAQHAGKFIVSRLRGFAALIAPQSSCAINLASSSNDNLSISSDNVAVDGYAGSLFSFASAMTGMGTVADCSWSPDENPKFRDILERHFKRQAAFSTDRKARSFFGDVANATLAGGSGLDNICVTVVPSVNGFLHHTAGEYGHSSHYILASAINCSVSQSTSISSPGSMRGSVNSSAANEHSFIILAEIGRPPSPSDIASFKFAVFMMQTAVFNFYKSLMVERQRGEIQSISNSLASTSQQLVVQKGKNERMLAMDSLVHDLGSVKTLDYMLDYVRTSKSALAVIDGCKVLRLIGATKATISLVDQQVSYSLTTRDAALSTPSVKTQNASYYFGSKYLADCFNGRELVVEAVGGAKQAIIDRFAALAVLTNTIIVCDSQHQPGSQPAFANNRENAETVHLLMNSVFVPIIGGNRRSLLAEESLALMEPAWRRCLEDALSTAVDLDERCGWSLQICFDSEKARYDFLQHIDSENHSEALPPPPPQSLLSRMTSAPADMAPYLLNEVVTSVHSWFDDYRTACKQHGEKESVSFMQHFASMFQYFWREVQCKESGGEDYDLLKQEVVLEVLPIDNIAAIFAFICGEYFKLQREVDLVNSTSEYSSVEIVNGSIHWQEISSDDKLDTIEQATSLEDSVEMWQTVELQNLTSLDTSQQEDLPDNLPEIPAEYAKQFQDKFHLLQLSLILLCKFKKWRMVSSSLSANEVETVKRSGEKLMLFGDGNAGDWKSPSGRSKLQVLSTPSHGSDASQLTRSMRLLMDLSTGSFPVFMELQLRVAGKDITAGLLRNAIDTVITPALPLVQSVRHTMTEITSKIYTNHVRLQQVQKVQRIVDSKKMKLSLMSVCLKILTAEGSKVTSVLQQIQEALQMLPRIQASTLICKDSITDKPLYEVTMQYQQMAGGEAPEGIYDKYLNTPMNRSLASMPSRNNFSFIDATKSSRDLLAGGMDGSPAGNLRLNTNFNASISPLPTTSSVRTSPASAMRSPLTREKTQKSLKFSLSALNKSSMNVNSPLKIVTTPMTLAAEETMEIGFECYEVTGSIVLYLDRNNLDDPIDLSDVMNSDPAAAAAPNTQSTLLDMSDRDLVALITRATARRVFELHRGNKNKKLMALKQEQLAIKTHQVAQNEEKLETLEHEKAVTQHELAATTNESDKLRSLMQVEYKSLKESLQQKRELVTHLRQSMMELRRETEKKEAMLTRQVSDLKERLRVATVDADKHAKEMKKLQAKEKALEANKAELTIQVTDLQRQLSMGDQYIKELRKEVEDLQSQLANSAATEPRLKEMLNKIKTLDEEVVNTRRNNVYLKKQLDTCTQALKTYQQEHAEQINSTQIKYSDAVSNAKRLEKSYETASKELQQTKDQVYQITTHLNQEKIKSDEYRERVAQLEKEREITMREWSDTVNR